VASVNLPTRDVFTAWANRHGRAAAFDDYTRLPIRVSVDYPERVGIDRLLAAVAVDRLRQRDRAAIVVDLGTAITVDLVEPDGSRRPLDPKKVAELDRKAWDRGAIVYARGSVLRLAPPLCITKEEVDELVGIVADSIDDLQRDVAR